MVAPHPMSGQENGMKEFSKQGSYYLRSTEQQLIVLKDLKKYANVSLFECKVDCW